mgnify:CR=1 FL=1
MGILNIRMWWIYIKLVFWALGLGMRFKIIKKQKKKKKNNKNTLLLISILKYNIYILI